MAIIWRLQCLTYAITAAICMTSSEMPEPPVGECSRFSPEEVYYTHIKPEITSKLNEMNIFFSVVLEQLQENVQTFIPPEKQSTKKEDLITGFQKLTEFLTNNVLRITRNLDAAWKKVFQANQSFLEEEEEEHKKEEVKGGAESILKVLEKVGEAHDLAQNDMEMVGREMSMTVKGMIAHVIQGLHRAMEKNPHPDHMTQQQVVEQAHKLIEQIAPNMFGKVLGKVMERGMQGLRGKDIATEEPVYIREVNKMVKQLIKDFANLEAEKRLVKEQVKELWEEKVGDFIARGGTQAPSVEEIRRRYSEEEQVVDSLINIMVTS